MLFGSTITGTDDGETKTETKEQIVRGEVVRRFKRQEELRLVGDRGDEVKDITAHYFAALGRYQKGEIQSFAILTDHFDKTTGKISRIKIVTESQE